MYFLVLIALLLILGILTFIGLELLDAILDTLKFLAEHVEHSCDKCKAEAKTQEAETRVTKE